MKKYIPNTITAIRLVLVPVFIYLFFNFDIRISFAVFILASLSDLLDGYLARKWNVISDFGKLFDPLADKAIQISAVICLAVKGLLPIWPVIIAFSKELLMLVGSAFLLKKRNFVVYSNNFGKIASFVFSSVVCLCFFRDFWFKTEISNLILDILVWIAVILSIFAMVQYAYRNMFKPMFLNKKDEEKEE